MSDEILLFVYGSLRRGEIHEAYLSDSFRLGTARTVRGYRLVELGQFPVMITGGDLQIEGELYQVTRQCLLKLDDLKENGRLFYRRAVELDDGQLAQAFLMDEDKLRGRRRLRVSDWRRRFENPIGNISRRGNS